MFDDLARQWDQARFRRTERTRPRTVLSLTFERTATGPAPGGLFPQRLVCGLRNEVLNLERERRRRHLALIRLPDANRQDHSIQGGHRTARRSKSVGYRDHR